MADIFISYAREDLSRIRPLVERLEEAGWSVWWDRNLPPGPKAFDIVIEEAIDAAKTVVVAWSDISRDRDWVRAEAKRGLDAKKLIQIRLDAALPGMIFRIHQSADFVAWAGDASAHCFTLLKQGVSYLAPLESPPPAPAPLATAHGTAHAPEAAVPSRSDTPTEPPAGAARKRPPAMSEVPLLLLELELPTDEPDEPAAAPKRPREWSTPLHHPDAGTNAAVNIMPLVDQNEQNPADILAVIGSVPDDKAPVFELGKGLGKTAAAASTSPSDRTPPTPDVAKPRKRRSRWLWLALAVGAGVAFAVIAGNR